MLTKIKNFLKFRSEEYLKELFKSSVHLVKWTLLAALVGVIVGMISTAFAWSILYVTDFRTAHPWLLYLLPLAGCLIVFLYKLCGVEHSRGTNLVLTTIQSKTELPKRMAPLIFISSVISHLFGASVGREGAALQLGGSVGAAISPGIQKVMESFRLSFTDSDRHLMIMAGMSAAFAAIFGTPIAAAVFPMEVISIGLMHFSALLPCVIASLVASSFASTMGIDAEAFGIVRLPDFTLASGAKIFLLAILTALMSELFCLMLTAAHKGFANLFTSQYLAIVVGGCLVIGLTLLIGSYDYLGAGVPMIISAMKGETPWYAFALKMLFTAIYIGAGYKGGEIVPSIFIGATFGCFFSGFVGLPSSLCAACGIAAMFVGVTNCPISTILISTELFGFAGIPYYLVSVAVSYVMSGYYGLYHEQRIVYSKKRTVFINQKVL
ncbi:MAG: chloride channel protein [Lachnospiraceae bacterium]|nr:chloride channel protein [Lachnospiraceae bacterium]